MTDALRRTIAAIPLPAPGLVLLLAFLAQLPLALNPGYFSHDELQWAARGAHAQWFAWSALDTFQYRPLTFNLWMWLSRHLFATPPAFHALLVLWGSANAALLCAVGRGFGMRPRAAAIGALCFALSPYATYVHGWVGCIADLIWLSCALLVAWAALRARHVVGIAIATAACTAIGLMAKEAALAIPVLAAVAWHLDRGRRPRWRVVLLASGAVAAPFLALRWEALLHAPREGVQYALSLANAPLRWIEYQLFPPIVPLLETFTIFNRGIAAHVIVAAVLWLGLAWALWRASPRSLAIFVLGGLAALAPVLLLGSAWNHYAYGFAAVASMSIAAAWHDAPLRARLAIAAYAGLAVLHGMAVMIGIHQVGRVQAVFSPALARAVQAHRGAPLRLRPAPGAREWVFVRLTHAIPEYDGVPIGDRVRLVGAGEAADLVIAPDGSLRVE